MKLTSRITLVAFPLFLAFAGWYAFGQPSKRRSKFVSAQVADEHSATSKLRLVLKQDRQVSVG